MAPSHLRSLQALELALRTGSLTAAAAALSITPAAVGQRIKALEVYLGVELLVRGRSGLRAAPALAAVVPHLVAAFRDLQDVAAMLDMQRAHELHIAAPQDFVDLWLHPRLDRFTQAFPNIRFCINGEGQAALRAGPADCEIRFGPVRESDQVEVLFRDFVMPIGSPEITARAARVTRRDRLEGFPLLHLDFYKDDPDIPDWTGWIRARRMQRTDPNRGIRYQRIGTVLEAVLANAGLALCGLALTSSLVDSGRLSLPFPVATGSWTRHAFQVRFRGDALSRPQAKRFREWLGGEAAATRHGLDRRTRPRRGKRRPLSP